MTALGYPDAAACGSAPSGVKWRTHVVSHFLGKLVVVHGLVFVQHTLYFIFVLFLSFFHNFYVLLRVRF